MKKISYLILTIVGAIITLFLINRVFLKDNSFNNQNQSSKNLEYFSCLPIGGNQILVEEQPYISGALVFKAKEGTSEKTIITELKKLGYDLETVNAAWGYSGIDRSTLFIRHNLTPEEADKRIRPIVEGYELEESKSGFYYGTAQILFKRLLDINEQDSIGQQLLKLKTQGKLTEYGWNIAPKQLTGFLSVPTGKEDEYIKKLYELNLFDCVSKKLNAIPYMPIVHT